jgi:hypothetical protein
MDEARYRLWEIRLKVLAVLGFVITFTFGIVQWTAQRRADRESLERAQEADRQLREREIARTYFDQAIAVYREAVQAAGELADMDPSQTDYQARHRQFMMLYNGPMCLVESVPVEAAMVQFNRALQSPQSERQAKAIELAHTCRDSLMRWSKLDLATIVNDWKHPGSPGGREAVTTTP